MPAAQNGRPSRVGQKWAKWTEEEDKRLLRLREADSKIPAREFCRRNQRHFPDRSEKALEQRFSTLKNREKGKSEGTPKSLIVILKLPKRPAPVTETMAQTNPSKQARLGGQHDGGMDCDVAPPIQIGQILPQNNPQYPQYTAPQSATTVPPRYTFQQPNAPGIPPFQPAFSSGSSRPVAPTAGQTAKYPHTTTRFTQPTPHIPVQADTVMSGTNLNNKPVPQAPLPAPAPAQQTDPITITESGESTDEESDDTSSTTDSELPDPDSLLHHGPAKPHQASTSASSEEGRTTTQKKTPKKAETVSGAEALSPATLKVLDSLSEEQFDEVQLHMIVRRTQMRALENIHRERDTAELRRRVDELERQLNTQSKQFQTLESAGSQRVAALEKRVADLVAQGIEDRGRLGKVEGLIGRSKEAYDDWNAQEGKVSF